jgi:hypothetical protein
MKIELEININALRACRIMASRDATRFPLCGVRLEADKEGINYIGCDGRRLLAVRNKVPQQVKEPVAFTIPNYMLDMVKAPTRKEPLHKYLSLEANAVSFRTSRQAVMLGGTVIQGAYPKWRTAVPLGPFAPIVGAGFDPVFAESFARAGAILRNNRSFEASPKGMTFWAKDGSCMNPMIVDCVAFRDADFEVVAVLMPIRMDIPHPLAAIPEWARKEETK